MSGQPEESNARLTRGSLLARNAYINLIGQILPILVAIFAIPLLIKVLGTERFGVLALAWVVMGDFGLFDFGMGLATTKFVAEHHARNETEVLPELIQSSIVAHLWEWLFFLNTADRKAFAEGARPFLRVLLR